MSEAAEPDLVGTIAGDYRVLSRLGTGAMGHVYEAERVDRPGEHVALKVLHRQRQSELAPRFLREAKTLALLSHPNIVQLVDMGQLDDGTLFLATELVRGRSLREILDAETLAVARCLSITSQVLAALEVAHELGVVHRDIKPENIMVVTGSDGDIAKVLDFGVAKLLNDTIAGLGEANLTSVGFSIFGSALYISPECVTGQPVDGRSDQYSVAAMLYEMLVGHPPFDHEDPSALLRAHAFDAPPTLAAGAPQRSFPAALEQLVAKALAKDPANRFANAGEMKQALDAVADGMRPRSAPSTRSSPSARPASTPAKPRAETPRPRPARRGFPWLTIVALLAGIGVGVGVAIWRLRSEPSTAAKATVPEPDERARSAAQLVAGGEPDKAIAALEPTLAQPSQADAPSLLVLGHARFAVGRRLDALSAYEQALALAPGIGDARLRDHLTKILGDGQDVVATVVALDLAMRLVPPATDAVVDYAAKGKLVEARRRAAMLAQRAGLGGRLDATDLALLELQHASCDERKRAIERLVAARDRKALPALKRAKAKCIEQEVAAAITAIETAK